MDPRMLLSGSMEPNRASLCQPAAESWLLRDWGRHSFISLLLAFLFMGSLAGAPLRRQWTSFAYPAAFEHITVEQGLSQNTVHCILQDKRGFLWFGTDAGLNRYDGFHFQVFHPEKDNPHSLSSDWILHLLEDHRGYLWIATRNGGVTILDPETGVMMPFQASKEPGGLPAKTVNSVVEDHEGNIWLATETHGLCMVSKDWKLPDKPRFQTFEASPQDPDGPPAGGVNALLYDSKGTLWIASRSRGIGRLVSKAGDMHLAFRYYFYNAILPDAHASTIVEDSFGLLWLGGEPGKINAMTPNGMQFEISPEGSSVCLHLLRDSMGRLWYLGDRSYGRILFPDPPPDSDPRGLGLFWKHFNYGKYMDPGAVPVCVAAGEAGRAPYSSVVLNRLRADRAVWLSSFGEPNVPTAPYFVILLALLVL